MHIVVDRNFYGYGCGCQFQEQFMAIFFVVVDHQMEAFYATITKQSYRKYGEKQLCYKQNERKEITKKLLFIKHSFLIPYSEVNCIPFTVCTQQGMNVGGRVSYGSTQNFVRGRNYHAFFYYGFKSWAKAFSDSADIMMFSRLQSLQLTIQNLCFYLYYTNIRYKMRLKHPCYHII